MQLPCHFCKTRHFFSSKLTKKTTWFSALFYHFIVYNCLLGVLLIFFFLKNLQDYYASIWFTFHHSFEIQKDFLLLNKFIYIKEKCILNYLRKTITGFEMVSSSKDLLSIVICIWYRSTFWQKSHLSICNLSSNVLFKV